MCARADRLDYIIESWGYANTSTPRFRSRTIIVCFHTKHERRPASAKRQAKCCDVWNASACGMCVCVFFLIWLNEVRE